MTEKPPFYITTPIYYVNDSPHIGHAYTTIACDVLARFMRLDGHEVKFLTGTDEHGQKVDKAAKAAGKDPQAFCDEVSQRFRNLVNTGDNLLNVINDDFIRTTEPRHKKACQELWKRLEANGHIYLDIYEGWYSVRDEAFYQEEELTEKDGKKFAPSGAEVEWNKEESYFFKLSEFQQPLLEFYKKNPDFVVPQSRYNEVKSFVEGGLKDLSISRTSFDWGVKVPEEVSGSRFQVPGNEKKDALKPDTRNLTPHHVMYVWIDALTNYLTATGWPDEKGEYKKFWNNPESTGPVHIIGKDILRFHAVYWPAFLMAAKLPMPKRIVAHGWWTIEGEKMSKSLGNVLSPQQMIEKAGGVDQLRYFMLRAMPFGNDGDFSEHRMIETINADLANNIGNLAQRSLSMIQKNCEGKVPAAKGILSDDEKLLEAAQVTLEKLKGSRIEKLISNYQFDIIIQDILSIASQANEYIDRQEPWKLKKDNPERMGTVLYVLAEVVRCIAIMLQPFCPSAAGKILDQLAVPKNQREFKHLTKDYALKPGTPLPPPQGVFPRLEVNNIKNNNT